MGDFPPLKYRIFPLLKAMPKFAIKTLGRHTLLRKKAIISI